MKYCKKCNHITNDGVEICPVCNKKTLNSGEPSGDFPTVILRASGFEKERVCSALNDQNISSDAVTGSNFADYDIMVPYGCYSKAFDLLVGINAIKPEESDFEDKEKVSVKSAKSSEFNGEDYYSTKNRIIRIISVILLLVLVTGVVLGVDAIMAFIKGLF